MSEKKETATAKDWLDYTRINHDENGDRWVNESDAFRKIDQLKQENLALAKELQSCKENFKAYVKDAQEISLDLIAKRDAARALLKEWQALWEEEINLAPHQRGREIFLNDERIIQKQRKLLRDAEISGMNILKSILSDQIGPEKVEKILNDNTRTFLKRLEGVGREKPNQTITL